MRITHKVNHGWAPNRNDPEWEDQVEREAARTTDATEKAHAKAQARLERAEAALDAARNAPKAQRQRVSALASVVEQRRQELLAIEALMRGTPAGSTNRGVGSYRPVPQGRTL